MRRIRWTAIGTVLLIVLSLVAAMLQERDLVLAFGLGAVSMAVLSLNESQ